MDYKQKYLKYKNKYLQLKEQLGGLDDEKQICDSIMCLFTKIQTKKEDIYDNAGQITDTTMLKLQEEINKKINKNTIGEKLINVFKLDEDQIKNIIKLIKFDLKEGESIVFITKITDTKEMDRQINNIIKLINAGVIKNYIINDIKELDTDNKVDNMIKLIKSKVNHNDALNYAIKLDNEKINNMIILKTKGYDDYTAAECVNNLATEQINKILDLKDLQKKMYDETDQKKACKRKEVL